MATTVAIEGLSATITVAGGVRYVSLFTGSCSRSSTESSVQTVVGSPGTYSNLYIRVTANSATATSTFVFRKNAATGSQTVSIGSGATGAFEDTTNTDTVVAGDLVNALFTPGVTGTSVTVSVAGIAFTATSNTVQRHCSSLGSNITGIASATFFPNYVTNRTAIPVQTETALEKFKLKVAGTLKNAAVKCTANARLNTTTVGVRLNGANATLVVSIAAGATGNFTDTTNSDAVVSGDLVGRYITIGAGTEAITLTLLSNDFITTDGSSQHIGTIDSITLAQAATRYDSIEGLGLGATTESDAQQRAIVAGTLSQLEIYVQTNTITATSTFSSRVNGAAGNCSVSIAGSTTGWFEDTTHSDAVVSSDLINTKMVGGAGGTSMTLWYYAAKFAPPPGGTPTTVITTQPSNVATGVVMSPAMVAKATTDGTTVDTAFTGNAVVTVASGSATVGSGGTVACVAGVATFSALVLNGSGPVTLTVTMAGYVAATSASFTVMVPALIVTTQPPVISNTGAVLSTVQVKATTDGTTIDTAFVGNITVALNLPTGASGSLAGTLTKAAVAGVANFTDLAITGDGAGYTITATAATYTSVTTSPVNVVGAIVAAWRALATLIAAYGTIPAGYDWQLNLGIVSSKVATWDDAFGPDGVRSPGPQITQPTSGNRGTIGSAGIAFASASLQYMTSAGDARFSLVDSVGTPAPLKWLVFARPLGNGPIASLAANPVGSGNPFMSAEVRSNKLSASVSSDGTGLSSFGNVKAGTFTADTNVVGNDGVMRLISVGKEAFFNKNGMDRRYDVQVAGRAGTRHSLVMLATAGSPAIAVNRLNATYGDCEIAGMIAYAGDWNDVVWKGFCDFGVARYAMQYDATYDRVVVFSGSSIRSGISYQGAMNGYPAAVPMNAQPAGGTTAPAYYAIRKNTGPRGTLATPGVPLDPPQATNYGLSQGDVQTMLDIFQRDIAVLTVGRRPRHLVNIYLEIIGNSFTQANESAASVLTKLQTLYGLHQTYGVIMVITTAIPRGDGADSGSTSINATGWYATNAYLAKSDNGTRADTVNAALRANPGLYADYVIDLEANEPVLSSTPLGNVNTACLSTRYFNIAGGWNDKTHLTPETYDKIAAYEKTALDTHDAWLWMLAHIEHGAAQLNGGLMTFAGGL